MNKRAAGISLIAIAAFLYSVKYMSAAIWGSGTTTWNSELFDTFSNSVGQAPLYLSWISLAAGILYLYHAEAEQKRHLNSANKDDPLEEVEEVTSPNHSQH
ncbi:hypothetical protein PQ456_06385 [Paenibacillus kyungheensis]|uniref:Uncharacterized protein n=1 Tax=Paenibacillus kyungheensis TaxID=1452732 RepID=A0AAX3M5N1_9BACL|nr:hypothetical protein [Paenibacillus kyungheensis]WCT57138.1 hypothetical protein PQ456_06385 [Paenibacillus kyungheensis]